MPGQPHYNGWLHHAFFSSDGSTSDTPAMYEWNDATFPACIAVAGALASITTNKDFNEAALGIML